MRAKVGSYILASVVALVVLAPRALRAQVYDFATCDPSVTTSTACSTTSTSCCKQTATAASSFLLTGGTNCTAGSCALVIPMDWCHQGTNTAQNTSAPTWCGSRVSNDAMMLTYGLIYRLLQNSIPVYWSINPSKFPEALGSSSNVEIAQDIDGWILDASVTAPPGSSTGLTAAASTANMPVKKMKGGFTSASFGYDTTYGTTGSYPYKQFPLRGSAFFISATDRANFNKFVNRQSPYTSWANRSNCYTGTGAGQPANCYDFTRVNIFEIQPNAYVGWTDFTGRCYSGSTVTATVCDMSSDCTAGQTCKWTGATTAPPGTAALGSVNFRAGEIPVAAKLNYAMPKIARFGSGGVAQKWLGMANLEDQSATTCATTGVFSPADSVYCAVSEANISAGVLMSGSFNWLWLDHQSLTCTSSGGTSTAKVQQFLTAVTNSYTPGNVMAIADAMTNETCASKTDHLLGSQAGASMTVPNGSSPSPLILRYPQSMFMQTGDIAPAFATGLGGGGWTIFSASLNGYNSAFGTGSDTLHRLVSQDGGATCTQQKSSPTCDKSASAGTYFAATGETGYKAVSGNEITDLTAYGRYLNNSANGIVYYLPGTQIHNQPPELRMLLDSLLATPLGTVTQVVPVTVEASRSSPVAVSILNHESLVQGSYEITTPAPPITTVTTPSDVSAFEFPYQKGHFRAVDVSTISTSGTTFASETAPLFDSGKSTTMPTVTASGCSSGADGTCRYIFTTTTATFRPTIVPVDTSHATTLATPMGISGGAWTSTDQQAFISKILAGHSSAGTFVPALGGVDRSTAAVIGPSPLVSGTRPTVAYFGASDGMLHAVCASVSGNCSTLGRELWAYVPRVNLGRLRLNTAKIDGSPRVIDALVDVTSGNGSAQKAWRTLLIFQTGSGDAATVDQTPAVYALDISDPFHPVVLWEYTTPTVRTNFELGQGLTIAANQLNVGGSLKWEAYAATNNGGTGGAAVVVVPIDIETGTDALGWKFSSLYTAVNSVPATALPGGAVGVFANGSSTGLITDLVFGDIQGRLWRIDPATGDSKYHDASANNIPLFAFTTDFHAIGAKPAIYSDGSNEFAIFATGGYADPSDSVWGTGVQQYLMGVSLTSYPTTSTSSLNENSGAPFVPVKVSLGANEKGFSQATIVGNEVFVTTDSTDVNASGYGTTGGTGHMYRYNLSTNTQGTTVALVTGGASSVANNGTDLYTGSNDRTQKLGNGAAGTTGNAVDSLSVSKVSRTLWLRTE